MLIDKSFKKSIPWIMFAAQVVIVAVVGFAVKDIWYKIAISAVGLSFNFLTCRGMRWGFIAGAVYALSNAAMSFSEQIYASAVFMLIIQLPMALYTFFTWKRAQQKERKLLKRLSKKQIAITAVAFPASIAAIYFILSELKSNGPFFDAVFFSITLISCVLLAFYYRSAYLFVCLSGFSGIALWLYQLIVNNTGASLMTLYVFVFLNSLSAIKEQYFDKSVEMEGREDER